MEPNEAEQDVPEDLSVRRSGAPADSDSAIRDQLDKRPSGLSLLVAALDAQDATFAQSSASMDSRSEASASPDGPTSSKRRAIPDVEKDVQYWEKRRRNNEAAKRSREKRRMHDVFNESKLAVLAKENDFLKNQLHTVAVVQPALPTVVKPEPYQPTTSLAASMPRLAISLSQPPKGNPNVPLANLLPPNPLMPFNVNSLMPSMPHSAAFLQLYHAHQQAALAAQHSAPSGLLAPALRPPQHFGAFQPVSRQASPDSTNFSSREAAKHGGEQAHVDASTNAQCLDGKQYLRFKLLERQNRLGAEPVASPANAPSDTPMLGSLLCNGPRPPPVKPEPDSSLPQDSGARSEMSLKQCLSSLAVHLGAGSSTTASSEGAKSDCSHSAGSLTSPASSQGTESNDSQVSPPQPDADRQANGSATGGKKSSSQERYVQRRKRNNEAAKRCRANRRALFEYRFQRAQQLEQENGRLKSEVRRLSDELRELRKLFGAAASGEAAASEAASASAGSGASSQLLDSATEASERRDSEP